VKRALAALVLVLVAAATVYYLFLRTEYVAPSLQPLALAGTIGEGDDAVVVDGRGQVLSWFESPVELELPRLPLDEPPPRGGVKGPMLLQARILAATPAALRPYVEGSRYSETGVVVELEAGIELRFGDASQAARKWKAAAAVLASEEIEALDYVDLHAPGSPAVDGESVLLPPLP
jgi:hypothetical protein